METDIFRNLSGYTYVLGVSFSLLKLCDGKRYQGDFSCCGNVLGHAGSNSMSSTLSDY